VIARSSLTAVKVRSPYAAGLAALRERLAARGVPTEPDGPDGLLASGITAEQVGDLAHEIGVRLHELSVREASLEQAYLELTAGRVEYAAPADDQPKWAGVAR
jgi:ABC-2 type transport system ATP-binding protein